MSTPFAPQPDADPDGRSLTENEGVNAGSAVPEPAGTDHPRDADGGERDTDAVAAASAPDQVRPLDEHHADVDPGRADTDLYGPESGQDSGSMA